MTTEVRTALKELSQRGITTLEQFVESKARMRKPRVIGTQKALEEKFARAAANSGASARSEIKAPAASVPIVLDGKRVDYNEIARLNGRPLDYVATPLKGGGQALVVFSDRSIMRNHHLRQFRSAQQAIGSEVETALTAGGLTPTLIEPRLDLGMRIFEHVNYGGDSAGFAPDEYVDDMMQFDDGLGLFGGDWNDIMSSVLVARCHCVAWEHIHDGGASITFYSDTPNLHELGWGDRISAVWARFTG
ncbi:hypothetical protein [Taklimakanibacter deserti]|uniref:hypothetical protein n=1 Tax=Taklimakanibacter deserti TaxID=2267839 RepID=UPI000E6497E6